MDVLSEKQALNHQHVFVIKPKKVKNKRELMYGEHDKLRWTIGDFVAGSIVIPRGTHNVFRSNPKGILEAVNQFLKSD